MIRERWSEVEISAYVDGQLAGERLAAFERTLAEDSRLQQRVNALHTTITLLRETPLRESPRNYPIDQLEAVRAVIQKQDRQQRKQK